MTDPEREPQGLYGSIDCGKDRESTGAATSQVSTSFRPGGVDMGIYVPGDQKGSENNFEFLLPMIL